MRLTPAARATGATLPLDRLGELDDLVKFVCIIDSKFTTGENFYLNGGQYMH